MQDAINTIKNLLNNNKSFGLACQQAVQLLTDRGLTLGTARTMVREISQKKPWY